MTYQKEDLDELLKLLPGNYVMLIRERFLLKNEPIPARWILNILNGEQKDEHGVIQIAKKIAYENNEKEENNRV
jgi:hypothetical protein